MTTTMSYVQLTVFVGASRRSPSLHPTWNSSRTYGCLLFVVGHNNSRHNNGHNGCFAAVNKNNQQEKVKKSKMDQDTTRSACCFLSQQTTIMTKCWLTNHQQTNKRETVISRAARSPWFRSQVRTDWLFNKANKQARTRTKSNNKQRNTITSDTKNK